MLSDFSQRSNINSRDYNSCKEITNIDDTNAVNKNKLSFN